MEALKKEKMDYRAEIEALQIQLAEALDTIEAIKSGEVDALIINGKNGNELYTLQTADHTYRIFIEKMSEGALTLSGDGLIVYCNSSFAEMVSRGPSAVIGVRFEEFVATPDLEKFRQLVARGWEQDVKGEISLRAGESSVPVQLSIATLTMSEGSTLSVIVTNLTSQKEALKQQKIKNDQLAAMNIALELSNHDLQQFASVASHDLQEPLRKIQVFSHLLEEKFSHEFSDVPKQHLAKIVSSASRMKTLIVDVLNYSRLSSNDNQYEKTDLKELVNELLEDLEMTIREKDASVIVRDLPVMEVNRGQMRQVFQNLVSNALKFSRRDERPVIELFSSKDFPPFAKHNANPKIPYYHIHVRDNGIGFDEKYSKVIFNLFEKLHSKDQYEGTGIGLAITRKIVEKHNGFIDVISHEGSGTEFIISLPIHQ